MKRIISISVVLFLIVVFVGCGRFNSAHNIRDDTSPNVNAFINFLSTLDKTDLNSVNQAVTKFEDLKSKNKSTNDELYRLFYDFYYKVIDYYNSSYYQGDLVKIKESDLKRNGLVVIEGEAGPYIFEKLSFIKSIFSEVVSEGVQKYIELDNEARTLRGGGFIFEDALLTMNWDELSDLIVKYEDYINNNLSYKIEVEKIQEDLNFCLYIYTQCLDTVTFAYMSDETDNEFELRDSYARFIKEYPKSKYQPIIEGYLDILKENGFILDNTAKEYLIKNGIEVRE